MAAEDIGYLFPTKIPGYDDAADIQAALRLYHYGSTTYDETNEELSEVNRNSISGQFKFIDEELATLEERGIGSEASATEPTNPVDGYIWMNTNTTSLVSTGAIAAYQDSAPTTNLVHGSLWVDKNSSPLTMYVYDTTGTPGWREIGA
jgi:hypothetical protein